MSDDEKIEKLETRLFLEEEALRSISPIEGAHGKNASDYRHMYDMFSSLLETTKVLKADPKAFVEKDGSYNDRMLGAYTRLMSTAIKGLSELNKMRNADRMVAHMLDEHTRELVQAASIEIGLELKNVIDSIEMGESGDEVAIRLKKLMYKKLPEIFLRSANDTLSNAKEEYGLIQ